MPLTLLGLPCLIFLSPTLRSGAAVSAQIFPLSARRHCAVSAIGAPTARCLPAQLALPDLAATSFLPTEPPASILPPDSLIAPPHNSQHYAQSQGFGARLDEYPKEPPNTAMTYDTSVQLRTQSFTSSAYELAMLHFPSLMNPAFNRYSNSAGAPPSAQIAPSTSPFNLSHPSSSTASAPIPQPPLASPLMHLERHHLQDLVPHATSLRALLLAANVPKRRGPDKCPGTRKRSCKKRQSDGSQPKKQRRGDPFDEDTSARADCKRDEISPMTLPVFVPVHHKVNKPETDPPAQASSFVVGTPSFPDGYYVKIDITTTLKSEVSPELPLSHPFESDLRSPETPSYDDSSPPPADDPVVNYSRNSWWDELLDAYAPPPTREQAYLQRLEIARTPATHVDSCSDVSAQRKRSQPVRRRGRVPRVDHNDRAIRRGSPYACRDVSNRATSAQAPAPLPQRHARQQQRKSNTRIPGEATSSADLTASATVARRPTHHLQVPEDIAHRRKHLQRDEKNKCDVQQRRHLHAHVCGVVGDRRRSPAHATAFTTPAATCTTPADQRQRTTRSIASPAAASAPASRGSSWLTQGSKSVLRVSNSVLKSRERVRDKSDFASGEKHSLANYLKHKRQGRHRIPAHAFTTPATLRPANAAQPKTSAPPRKTDSSVQDEHSRHPTLMRSDTRDRHALTLICHPLADRAEDNQGHQQPQERRQRPQSRTQQTRDDFTHSTRLASAQTQQQPTPAIGTGTTSERLRRTRMTEDSQDLSEEMIRLRSPWALKRLISRFIALLFSLYSPTLSALLHAF
ncbi:hypothetical protein EDB85DRAFT_2149554 [Lactarius pseudohatsudake]|nr:hypothetical protein EDB85DRAFT_2227639 [Lactarius pseudohatsudake]KAH9025801.1 hypothetical protein EDB85DRAFT_2149554 [Lactarius pseudohatsudake]